MLRWEVEASMSGEKPAPTAAEVAEAARFLGVVAPRPCHDAIRVLTRALDAAEAEKKSWQDAERALSDAYVRLRTIIPGALRTPHNPAPEEMWSIVESAAASLLLRAETAERERDEARAALATRFVQPWDKEAPRG